MAESEKTELITINCRAGRPGPMPLSPSTLNPGSSAASSLTPVGPSAAVAAVSAHWVTSPVEGVRPYELLAQPPPSPPRLGS
jgi:hypothetical protein